MKKINYYCLLFSFCIYFACNNNSLLEQDDFRIEVDCRLDYPDDTNIRLASVNNNAYSFEVLDGNLQLVEIKDSGVVVEYVYVNNKVIQEKQYQLPSNELSQVEQTIYDDKGFLKEQLLYQKNTNFANSRRILYETDEKGRRIREEHIFPEVPSFNMGFHTYEWDDCNIKKVQYFDVNGEKGFEINYFYDDKLNPYNLQPLRTSGFATLSKNNILISEHILLNNPDYIGFTFTEENTIFENQYEYGEFNLPIRKVNAYNVVRNYSYKID